MPKQPQKSKVLLVTEDSGLEQDIIRNFDLLEEFQIISSENSAKELDLTIRSLEPDMILLDFNFDQERIFDFIDDIVVSHPGVPIVVIMGPENIQNTNSVILSGARAFITTPIEIDGLEKTLNRVIELTKRYSRQPESREGLKKEEEKKGQIFVVFSPKGGVGCTTIATNLAISMQKHYSNVLLLDGKFLFGHVTLALNIRTVNSIIDLIGHVGNLDEGLIRQVTIPHHSGIDILPAPNSISEGQGIRPEDLFNVLKALQNMYGAIVIDAGNFLDENTVTLMDAATYILLVLTPEIASMRDTRKYLDIARNLGYPRSKLKLILNKAGRRADMHVDEIERVIKSPVIGTIALDVNAMSITMNEGTPIVIKRQRHEISRAFSKLAKKLSALPKVIQQNEAEKSSALDQSSQFG